VISCNAYIIRQRGVAPSFEEIKIDGNLLSGQVLVRILYSGLCATQIEEIFTSSRNEKYMPHLFGHEGVAEVINAGSGVTKLAAGDHVVVHWKTSSVGLDAPPGSYWQGMTKVNAGKVVTFAEYAVVPENRLTKLPRNINIELAAVLGCAYPTGWGSIRRVGNLVAGERVLIVGIGGVGLAALSAALKIPKTEIFVADRNQIRLSNVAKSFPFVKTIRLSGGSLREIQPNLVLETSGSPEVLEVLADFCPLDSRIVLVGMPPRAEKSRINTQRMLDGLQILGSNGGGIDFGSDSIYFFQDFKDFLHLDNPFKIFTLGSTELPKAIDSHKKGEHWKIQLSF
jgi:D-arabinose 1-dehydrogenase-like Zn-dependent alcohol dehydrogenase